MVKKQSPQSVEPSDLAGEWSDCRGMYFWHHKTPAAMKRVIEKTAGTRLKRDAADTTRISYGGATRGGGELQAVWLRFEAVVDSRKLYSLVVKRTAPRRWVKRASFIKDARQTFASWCCKFEVPARDIPWADNCPALFEELRRLSIALEAGAADAADTSDGVDAAAHQGAAQAPRREKVFFTAHREAGTRLFFDEDAPAQHPPDSAAVACLDHFFDWSRRQDPRARSLPAIKGDSETGSWQRIVHQLVLLNA